MKALLYILSLAGIIAACTSVDCSENALVQCKYQFIDAAGKTDTVPNLLTVSMKNSLGELDTLINLKAKATTFSVPMTYALDADTLILSCNDTLNKVDVVDKIIISKTNTPHYDGYECDMQYFHEITDAQAKTTNFIQQVIINNPTVTNDQSVTNIYLFLQSGY